MQCPYCQAKTTATLDSRQAASGRRRRRHCTKCDKKFTTEEKLFRKLPMVSKSNGQIEDFNEDKLRASLQLALRKRGVEGSRIDHLVDKVKGMLYSRGESDVATKWIGNAVMTVLKQEDTVAYIRYASVYRAFSDMDAFMQEIDELKKDLTPEQRSMQMSLLDTMAAKHGAKKPRRRK